MYRGSIMSYIDLDPRTGHLNLYACLPQALKDNAEYVIQKNKHTDIIAKAIQVPHRPQQIQICNH